MGDDGKVRSCTVKYKPKSTDANGSYTGSNYTYIERGVQRLVLIVPCDGQPSENEIEGLHVSIIDDILNDTK